jgi:hypothetical protein
MRIETLGFQVRFGARDEEAARLVQVILALKVEIATTHHVVSPGLRQQQVEHVDILHLAVGDMNNARTIAARCFVR